MKVLSLTMLAVGCSLCTFSQTLPTLQSVTEATDGNHTTRNVWIGMTPGGGVTENALNIGGKIKLLGAAQAYTMGADANQPTIYRSGAPTMAYPFNAYDNLILQAGQQGRDILFVTGSTPTERLVVKGNGSIGIGTSTPIANLDIATNTNTFGLKIGDANQSNIRIAGTAAGAAGYGIIQTFTNGSTAGGNLVLQQDGSGKVGIGLPSPQCILHTVSYNNSDRAAALLWGQLAGTMTAVQDTSSNYYALNVCSNVSPTGTGANNNGIKSLLFVRADGNVGIGTSKPGTYKLAVEGTVGARRIKVTQQSSWADFVFHDNYQLPSLPELEKYIQQHKHLPDVPTEKEVQENGFDVGNINATLLQKVEELTLYIIQLNKKNETLESRIAEMEKKKN
ncbi:hypothetical protein [Chitinophaga qingshengii]|uniref:Peptidase S74 domain-containing protein n=1 Tax=Chitinophaga qingshengii TaxID=1569794 RepID=A0ABR7TRF8_9BACT|nr:hypothetical protein [Chitinophaga qingshengii]MBC9933079.1 hypothetical protein [Chitinophaga qingshengii]